MKLAARGGEIAMQRREFILLTAVAAAWSNRAVAETERIRRLGVLMAYPENDAEATARIALLRGELQKLGWAEGRNLAIDIYWGTVEASQIDQSARQLVASQPDLVVSSSTSTTAALLQYTRTIPIVFATAADPVGSGFVASMSRPGGNATGFTNTQGSMAGKWLQMLKQVAPMIDRAALLFNPATSPFAETYLEPFRIAAASLGVEAIAMPVTDTVELESAVARAASTPNGGIVMMPGSFMSNHIAQLVSLTARHRLPAIFPFRYYAEQGGLLSYGSDQHDNYRRAAAYVDRILKGDKVGELPVQSPVKFELTINLKTAKALVLTVPPALIAQADELFE